MDAVTPQKLQDEFIENVLSWLRNVKLREVCLQANAARESPSSQVISGTVSDTVSDTVSNAVNAVLQTAKKQTYQQTKALKQRAQVEAIASQCLQLMPPACNVIIELGAGQALLGHTISLASSLPLIAVERRSNTNAFDTSAGSTPSVRVQGDIASFSACPVDSDLDPVEPQLSLACSPLACSPCPPKTAALVCKHLCGHSFDEALSLAVALHEQTPSFQGFEFGFMCGAPCCHATMRWESLGPGAQRWFRDLGMPVGADPAESFSLLTDIIRLARVGSNETPKGSKACAKWRLRRHLDDSEAVFLGQKVCRLIDEERLVRLEGCGMVVRLLEYCHHTLSPDNILFLARPREQHEAPAWPEPSPPGLLESTTYSPPPLPPLPPLCLLIELDPTAPQSLVPRLAAVLLDIKAAESLPITVSGLADASHVLACSVLAPPSELAKLLQNLSRRLLLQMVVSRFIALTDTAADLSELISAVRNWHEHEASERSQVMLRISARPRSLEPSICAELPSDALDPVHFTHVLTVNQGHDLRYSILPRGCFDPSSWSDAKRNARKDVSNSKLPFRFLEAGIRFKARVEATALVLWRDTHSSSLGDWAECASHVWGSDIPLAELRPASSSGWAARVDTCSDVSLLPIRGTWYALQDGRLGAHADLLLVDASSTGEEAVSLVRRILQEPWPKHLETFFIVGLHRHVVSAASIAMKKIRGPCHYLSFHLGLGLQNPVLLYLLLALLALLGLGDVGRVWGGFGKPAWPGN